MPGCECIQWLLAKTGCTKNQDDKSDPGLEIFKVVSNSTNDIINPTSDVTESAYINTGFQLESASSQNIQVEVEEVSSHSDHYETSCYVNQGFQQENIVYQVEVPAQEQQVEVVLSVNDLNQALSINRESIVQSEPVYRTLEGSSGHGDQDGSSTENLTVCGHQHDSLIENPTVHGHGSSTENPTVHGHQHDSLTENPTVQGHQHDSLTENPTVHGHQHDSLTENPTVQGHGSSTENPTVHGHGSSTENPTVQGHQHDSLTENLTVQGQHDSSTENTIVQRHQHDSSTENTTVHGHQHDSLTENPTVHGHQHDSLTEENPTFHGHQHDSLTEENPTVQGYQHDSLTENPTVQGQHDSSTENPTVHGHQHDSLTENPTVQGHQHDSLTENPTVHGHQHDSLTEENPTVHGHQHESLTENPTVQGHQHDSLTEENPTVQGYQCFLPTENCNFNVSDCDSDASSVSYGESTFASEEELSTASIVTEDEQLCTASDISEAEIILADINISMCDNQAVVYFSQSPTNTTCIDETSVTQDSINLADSNITYNAPNGNCDMIVSNGYDNADNLQIDDDNKDIPSKNIEDVLPLLIENDCQIINNDISENGNSNKIDTISESDKETISNDDEKSILFHDMIISDLLDDILQQISDNDKAAECQQVEHVQTEWEQNDVEPECHVNNNNGDSVLLTDSSVKDSPWTNSMNSVVDSTVESANCDVIVDSLLAYSKVEQSGSDTDENLDDDFNNDDNSVGDKEKECISTKELHDWVMMNEVDKFDVWLQTCDVSEKEILWCTLDSGKSLISEAVELDRTEILALFLKAGVSLERQNEDGRFLILSAIAEGNKSTISFLASLGHCELQDENGMTVLHQAAKEGDRHIISYVIDHAQFLDKQSSQGWTALHYAVSEGYREIVKLLLEKNDVDINAKTCDSKSSLAIALEKGHVGIAKVLISHGANMEIIDELDDLETHPLFSPQNNYMMEYMLNHGANPNMWTCDGRTPLHIAAQNGRDRMLDILVENGADIDQQDKDGCSPLMLAIKEGHRPFTIGILALGADANISDKDGSTPLYLACEQGNSMCASQILHEALVDVDRTTSMGKTALHIASHHGYSDMVALLLAASADVTLQDSEGRTALHEACQAGHLTIVVQLEYACADPDIADNNGNTPLMAAAVHRITDVVQYLVTKSKKSMPLYMFACTAIQQDVHYLKLHGVNFDKQDLDGMTPLHHAIAAKNSTVATMLIQIRVCLNLKNRDGNTALHVAAETGMNDIVELLCKGGALNVPNENGEAPVCLAVSNGNKETLIALVKNGAAADTKMKDGKTCIFVAIEKNNVEIVDILLKYGCNVNYACSGTMQRPLHLAAKLGYQNIVKTLLDHRASVNLADFLTQKTPLHFAAEEGHFEVVIALLQSCVNVNMLTVCGEKAIHFAARNGHIKIVDTLLRAGTEVRMKLQCRL